MKRYSPQSAFTLLEMLIALIMFSLITLATSFALTSGTRTQRAAQLRAEELQEVRSIFEVMARDFRSTYVSSGNRNTLFVATGDTTGTLVTFSTLVHRLEISTNLDGTPSEQLQASGGESIPQSELALVVYSADGSGTLTRTENAIPNPEIVPPVDSPAAILSRRVQQVNLLFLDGQAGQTPTWNFLNDTANQTATTTSTTGGTTTAAAPTSTNQTAMDNVALTTETGNQNLPLSVQISITIINSQGLPEEFTTTVALANPYPQLSGQTPPPPVTAPTTGTGGGGAGGGTGGGGTGGGGGAPAGGGANGPRSVTPILGEDLRLRPRP